MAQSLNSILKQKTHQLCIGVEKLDAYSPLKILHRGYSLVYDHGKILKNVDEVKVGDALTIKLDKGELLTEVMEVKKHDI